MTLKITEIKLCSLWFTTADNIKRKNVFDLATSKKVCIFQMTLTVDFDRFLKRFRLEDMLAVVRFNIKSDRNVTIQVW